MKHAYEQLVAEGEVYTKARQGYFIGSLNEWVIYPCYEEAVIEEEVTTEATPACRYSLSHMSTNLSVFPVKTWLKIQGQVLKSWRDALSEVPHIKGARLSESHQIQPDIRLTTPSHQFPIGRIMPISRRIALLNWAMQTASHVIEDDDSEFKYGTDNIPS